MENTKPQYYRTAADFRALSDTYHEAAKSIEKVGSELGQKLGKHYREISLEFLLAAEAIERMEKP